MYLMLNIIFRDRLGFVMMELERIIEQNEIYAHFPIEVRFVKSDNLLLSPSHDCDTVHINLVSFKFLLIFNLGHLDIPARKKRCG
ncbi:hypothetical protein HZS_2102 [Henneguya salminicola]|nr:hypothetical protein HZS_2102 [Henneguya salminicola]